MRGRGREERKCLVLCRFAGPSAQLCSALAFVSAGHIHGSVVAAPASTDVTRGPSGLPLPRFVSLKSGKVNSRIGPGVNYSVDWMYLKPGLPMEIIQEYDNWRRVRDSDGAEGWINQSLLSGRRTGDRRSLAKGQKASIDLMAEPGSGGAHCRDDRAWRDRNDQALQRRLVRNDLQRPYRLDQPVAGLGRLSRRSRQGLTLHGCNDQPLPMRPRCVSRKSDAYFRP